MKLNNIKKQAGLTLIEVTLVIAVLLGLISVLFIGVSAYREGSNRAKCILNITNVQKAARSYQNLYELKAGQGLDNDKIIGTGLMIEKEPVCPSGGGYTIVETVTEIGVPFATCSLGTTKEHRPTGADDAARYSGW